MNNQKKYFVVKICIDGAKMKNDLSELAMNTFAADGVEEFSLIESQVDTILGERAYSGGDVPESVIDEVNEKSSAYDQELQIYFYQDDYEEKSNAFFQHVKTAFPELKVNLSKENWEDWNEKWREQYSTIKITDDLYVVPSWEKKRDGDHEIYIYPGQGFGTGGHETTELCLRAFEEFKNEIDDGTSCLDFGCGSGILGIAGIKRKKMHVDFCDIDRAALENCLQNLELNFKDQSLEGCSLISRERFNVSTHYELIFANILENILVEEKEVLLSGLGKGGLLILSGILNNQVSNIKKQYRSLTLLNEYSKGDWSCLIFKRDK